MGDGQQSSANPQKVFWLRRAHNKLVTFKRRIFQRKRSTPQEQEAPAVPTLNRDVYVDIISHLDLKERVRMRAVSRDMCSIVDRMPVRLPFLMLHSEDSRHYELLSDELDFVAGYLLNGYEKHFRHCGDSLAMSKEGMYACLEAIVLQSKSVDHLWLDCKDNGEVAKFIVDCFIQEKDVRKRFSVNQLTIIGSSQDSDFDWYFKLILLVRLSLISLRLRHVCLHSEDQARSVWYAIGECHKLAQLQYEPCNEDIWSREHMVSAIETKEMKSLIVTGVTGLTASDLARMSKCGSMCELSVVSESIRPSILASNCLSRTIANLNSLLIQVDSWFSLNDPCERTALASVLRTMPPHAYLEVVQVFTGPNEILAGASDIARAFSYWLELSGETARAIKVKIDDIGQERMDAAVGKILRKCRDVARGEWTPQGIWLEMGVGKLLILDRKTWFGDDDLLN